MTTEYVPFFLGAPFFLGVLPFSVPFMCAFRACFSFFCCQGFPLLCVDDGERAHHGFFIFSFCALFSCLVPLIAGGRDSTRRERDDVFSIIMTFLIQNQRHSNLLVLRSVLILCFKI